MIDPRTTLGDLVTANPARARTLEDLDLDYCCEGRRSLEDACREAGREVGEVVAALDEVDARAPGQPADWAGLSVPALLDHIVAGHHAYLRAEAPRLVELGRKVASVHGDRHPELATVVATFEQLWGELEPHLDEEEGEVFPALRAVAAGEDRAIDLAGLRGEHDAAGALLDRLRADTKMFETPADGCASYQAFYAGLAQLDADTRLHVHKENNVVFPAVERERTGV